MAEDTPAAAPEVKAKAPKKKAATQPKNEVRKESLKSMVINTVDLSKDRKGTSMPNIKKHLQAEGVDVERENKRINTTVKKLVDQGTLVQTKGTGASGSYKLAKTDGKPAKKTPTEAKKTTTTKTTAKKTTTTKTTAKKTTGSKAGAKKSAKRGMEKTAAKKPTAGRATPKKAEAAKTTSPKKTTAAAKVKPASKSTAKKNAAKKPAAKKGSKK